MMTTSNIFSPANGSPMVGPSQDMVMGNYYLTYTEPREPGEKKELRLFRDTYEAIMALEIGKIDLHTRIIVRLGETKVIEDSEPNDSTIVETTAGRCVFNDMLPAGMPFYNKTMSQKMLSRVISDCFKFSGSAETVDLLDRIKNLGFKYATLAGLSFGITDLKIPEKKVQIIEQTEKKVSKIHKNYDDGVLTEGERYNQVVDAWTNARVAVTNEMMKGLKEDTTEDGLPYLNPIYLMSDSGARGSVDQIQQLAGMRALMAKPSGEIIETPIKANFREGLTVLEYFSSTHGARKGLADTALKTAIRDILQESLSMSLKMLLFLKETARPCRESQKALSAEVSKSKFHFRSLLLEEPQETIFATRLQMK